MGIKYIVSTSSIAKDLKQSYKIIKDSGFYVEIGFEHLESYTNLNIEPYAIHLPYEKTFLTHPDKKTREDSVKMIICELKKAHLKKVNLAILHIEGASDQLPKIPIREKVSYFKIEASKLLKNANKYGIKIALENNGYIKDSFSNPLEILMVIKDLAKHYTNIGICFDIGHANIYAHQAGIDLVDIFKLLKKYIVHIHLHENHGERDEHLPLQGIFNKSFYKKLLTLENVTFSFETKGKPGINSILKSKNFIKIA
jgi:sugar phosphate isomerase/epimerase